MGKRLTVTALVCALLLQAGCAANTQQEEPMASAPSAESAAETSASSSAATEPSTSEAAEGLYPSSYLDTGNLTGDTVVHIVRGQLIEMTEGIFQRIFGSPYPGGEFIAIKVL